MSKESIRIIQKNGISYFKPNSYYNIVNFWANDNILAEKCPGDPSWYKVSVNISKLESEHNGGIDYVAYKIRDTYKVLSQNSPVQFPEVLSVEKFNLLEDESEKKSFYEPVIKQNPNYRNNIEFVIIDRDCEPVKMLPGVNVQFPYDLEKYPETFHKYPCSITGDSLFEILYSRVSDMVKSDKKYSIEDYRSIGVLRAYETLKINFQKKEVRRFYPSLRAKKMVSKEYLVENTKITLLEIYAPKYKSNNSSSETVPALSAPSYAELLEKINNYIDSKMRVFDSSAKEVCACCKGVGVVFK